MLCRCLSQQLVAGWRRGRSFPATVASHSGHTKWQTTTFTRCQQLHITASRCYREMLTESSVASISPPARGNPRITDSAPTAEASKKISEFCDIAGDSSAEDLALRVVSLFTWLSSGEVDRPDLVITRDQRIQELLAKLEGCVSSLDAGVVSRLCEAVLSVPGVTSNTSGVVDALLNQLAAVLPHVPPPSAIDMLVLLHSRRHKHSAERKGYTAACDYIKSSIDRLTSCHDLYRVLRLKTRLSSSPTHPLLTPDPEPLDSITYKSLEERLTQSLPRATAGETLELIMLLAHTGRRNVPLLRAAADRLTQMLQLTQGRGQELSAGQGQELSAGHEEKLSAGPEEKLTQNTVVELTTGVLYSYARLNMFPAALMSAIKELLSSPGVVSILREHQLVSVLTSMGHMKWREPAVLAALTALTKARPELISRRCLMAFTRSLAVLGYRDPACDEVMSERVVASAGHWEELTPHEYLDLVWSVTVLGRVTGQLAATVLSPHFMKLIIEDKGSRDALGVALSKLIQINNYMILLHEGPTAAYDGPKLPESMKAQIAVGKDRETFIDSVLSCVETIAPHFVSPHKSSGSSRYEQHFKAVQPSGSQSPLIDSGCCLDAAFYVDKQSGKPVSASDVTMHNHENYHKVSIQCLSFGQMTRSCCESVVEEAVDGEDDPVSARSGHIMPLGVHQLERRVTECQGYRVIQVPYTEFSSFTTKLARVKYIQRKLDQCVASARRNEE